MAEWFDLVNERNALVRREEELRIKYVPWCASGRRTRGETSGPCQLRRAGATAAAASLFASQKHHRQEERMLSELSRSVDRNLRRVLNKSRTRA